MMAHRTINLSELPKGKRNVFGLALRIAEARELRDRKSLVENRVIPEPGHRSRGFLAA